MIRVRPVDLKPRESFTLVGGSKQDKTRALLISMLPLDGSMYQAADIAKLGWPGQDQNFERKKNCRALYDLAHEHGLSGKKESYPGPDNLGADGLLLPGKKKGTRQRPKWNAHHWREIISDEIWQWCVDFMTELRSIEASHQKAGRRMIYFYDDATGIIEKTQENEVGSPTTVPLNPTSTNLRISSNEYSMLRKLNPKLLWGSLIFFAALMIGGWFLKELTLTNPIISERFEAPAHWTQVSLQDLQMDQADYIKTSVPFAQSVAGPRPPSWNSITKTWSQNEFKAQKQWTVKDHPSMFLAGIP